MPVASSTSTTPSPQLLNNETLLSFAAIAPRLPGYRANAHVNSATLWRWATKGLKVGGRVIRLEAVRVGCGWKTSIEAVERFVAGMTAASIPADEPPQPAAPTPGQRRTAAERDSAELDRILGGRR